MFAVNVAINLPVKNAVMLLDLGSGTNSRRTNIITSSPDEQNSRITDSVISLKSALGAKFESSALGYAPSIITKREKIISPSIIVAYLLKDFIPIDAV